jgi:signal transduction histidine kinase
VSWALGLAAATVAGGLFAAQWVLSGARGEPIAWSYALAWVLPEWWLWAALAPLIFALGRRFPIARAGSLPAHVVAAATLAVAHALAFALVTWRLPWADIDQLSLDRLMTALVLKKSLGNLAVYAAILGGHALYQRVRHAERLETELARAQLQALRVQLQPHFLFNALNAVSELIHRDPRAADRMVARLGDLLRTTLEGDGQEEVPLARELEVLERYLEVERVRFPDRLAVEIDVPPGCLRASVPSFILQPLVENAVRHGIAARPGAGRIEVRARRDRDRLHLVVRDDGPGLRGAPTPGVGLGSSTGRVERLGGRLTLRDLDGRGVEAELVLPFQESRGQAADPDRR